MSVLRKSTRKASARTQIDIQGVRDGILRLPGNHYRMVVAVSAVNFELKSAAEQDVLIDTYESFLNGLDSPLQILIRTREVDMDNYLAELASRAQTEAAPHRREQLANYDAFIRTLITNNTILSRQFYVVVPYDNGSRLAFAAIKEQLQVRSDIVQKGLARLGMQSRQLTDLEILDLFYSFYNPAQAKLQPLSEQAFALLTSSFIRPEPAL